MNAYASRRTDPGLNALLAGTRARGHVPGRVGLVGPTERVRIAGNATQAGTSIGFTSPVAIWEKIANLHQLAASLDREIKINLPETSPYRAAWDAWFARETAIYEKYAGPNYSTRARFGVLFGGTDALDREIETQRGTFNSFQTDYARQISRDGRPVGVPSTPSSTSETARSGGSIIPWWFWLLLGTGIAVGGYALYKSYQRQRRIQAAVLEELPGILATGGATAPQGLTRAAQRVNREEEALAARDCGCEHRDD